MFKSIYKQGCKDQEYNSESAEVKLHFPVDMQTHYTCVSVYTSTYMLYAYTHRQRSNVILTSAMTVKSWSLGDCGDN